MIERIERIKDLGVFSDFRWGSTPDLNPFQRYNLFYGLNGSGKTTLSRFFIGLNDGSCREYPGSSYELKTDSGTLKQGDPYPQKLRIFNTDYVHNNIGEIEGHLHPIFILGEENKALVLAIESEEKEVASRKDELLRLRKAKETFEKQKGKVFTDVATIISENTSGQATRKYRKPDAEKAYDAMGAPAVLSSDSVDNLSQTLRQERLSGIIECELPVKLPEGISSLEEFLNSTIERVTNLLLLTADSQAIERLKENPDIANWLEQGIGLRKKHSSDACEFCLQKVPDNRLEQLAKHFSSADQDLKGEVNRCIGDIEVMRDAIDQQALPPEQAFYAELREDFRERSSELKQRTDSLVVGLNNLIDKLRDKLTRRTESIADTVSLPDGNVEDSLAACNEIIRSHNLKTEEFQKQKELARTKLEQHYLSTIRDDVEAAKTAISECSDKIDFTERGDPNDESSMGIGELEESIKEKRSKISSSHKAGEMLTKRLSTFLGRGDLSIETEGSGYRITRHGHAAKNLSEGEKTAIAFVYFTVQLNDQDFDIENGTVVIDDPISSLDSGSTFQAFSFLKNAVKDAKQVILFTHNFDFLKLLLNWLKRIPKAEGKKSYYMLTCATEADGTRKSSILPMDKELLSNESEYNFVFKTLYQFRSDGTIGNSYHIPNMARKLLETFLDFQFPESGSLYSKIEKLDFSDQFKKTSLLKYCNDLSHATGKGFDPALVAETQTNVKHIMDMIQEVAPKHFQTLIDSINS